MRDDEVFLNQCDIVFNSNQLFEEWKKLGNIEKRAGILSTMLGIQTADGQPYFHIDYLIDKIMKLTPEEKEENQSYWIKSKAGAGAAEGETGVEGGEEAGTEEVAPEASTEEAGGGEEAGGEAGAEGGEFEF